MLFRSTYGPEVMGYVSTAVIAIIESANVASLRVAQKAGFNTFDTVQFHGRPVRVYRLTHQDWKAP